VRSLLFFFSFFLSCSLFSQVTIHGTVYDHQSDELFAVSVEHLISGQNVKTDKKGNFTVKAQFGDSLRIRQTGFHTQLVYVTDSTLRIYLQPVLSELEEVVVSSNLREIKKSNSPIIVETYSSRFLKKNPGSNLFEALAIMNGVQPQLNCNICNTGDIHINGMEGAYTMVLIDGMPVVSSLATVYGFSGIPAGMIKRVEIVKGPSSTLYGSEAVAGLINIITKDPTTAPKFSADLFTTSYNEYNVDLSTSFSIGKSHSLLGMNLFDASKRWDVNADNFTDVALQKRYSLFNKWEFNRSNGKAFRMGVRLLSEERWGGQMQWNQSWKGTDSIYGEVINTKRVELIGSYDLNLLHENLVFEYSYNYHEQDSYYGVIPYFAKQQNVFTQLRWNKVKGKHKLLSGIPFRFSHYDDNSPATFNNTANRNQPSNTFLNGAFFQDEWDVHKNWVLLSGIRLEWTRSHGFIPAPRLAVKWRLQNNQIIRLGVGNGFRVVNLFTEDHAALSGAREVVIQEQLKPERSWNANLNYSVTATSGSGFVNVDASLFYTWFSNKIIPDYDTDPQKIIYTNMNGFAVSRGATINTELVRKNGIRSVLGITIMDVFNARQNETGGRILQRQLFAPVFSANYAFSYTLPKLKWTCDLTGKVYGPQRLPVVPNDYRPEYAPWFTLMNLQVTGKLGSNCELYISVKNVLNFMPRDPILRPEDPFDKRVNDPVNNPLGYTFDPSYNYAPLMQRRCLIGFRFAVGSK
jgi:outer membrane receptor for ferrienterochelin and colicins